MANSYPSFNHRRTAARSSRPVPAPCRFPRHARLHHGLLVLALTLPAAAWASGPDPDHAPDGASADRPPQTEGFAAEVHNSPGPLPPQHASRTFGKGAVRRAMMPAPSPPFPTSPAASVQSSAASRAPGAQDLVAQAIGVGHAASRARGARALPSPIASPAQRDAPAPEPDFLFGRPRMSFGLRGLWHRARAGSDFYDFVNEELFVRRSPEDDHDNPDHGLLRFDAPAISFDFGYGVASRLDVRVGVDYAESLNESELRNWIGEDGLPYTQQTELSQTDVRGELSFALAPRGRAIGQYAWIPSRVVPYVGAGLSFVRHDLRQEGEFVDEIGYFQDTFTSSGWGTGVHLFLGADIRMTRHAFLNAEVRHVEASAGLSDEFAGFDPLDLGGLRISAGVRFVF